MDAGSQERDVRCHRSKKVESAGDGANIPLPGHVYTLPAFLLSSRHCVILPYSHSIYVLFIDSNILNAYQGSSALALLLDLWYNKLLTVRTATEGRHILWETDLWHICQQKKREPNLLICVLKIDLIQLGTTGIKILNKQACILFLTRSKNMF